MIKIPATSGSYYMDSGSNGTYHELVAKFVGQFTGMATVHVQRQGSETWEQYNSFPLDVTILSSGIVLGSIARVRLDLTQASGSGYAEVTLTSREYGVPDNMAKGRPRLNYVSIQNRDQQAVYFWHGLVPTSFAQLTYLPLDPATWTAQQKLDAGVFIQTYGEAIAAGASYEPNLAQTGPLYSYVAANTAKAHVKVG